MKYPRLAKQLLPTGPYTKDILLGDLKAAARRGHGRINRHVLNAISSALPKERPLTVVDIGAGIGKFVKHLKDWGVIAWGLDGVPEIFELSEGLVYNQDLVLDCAQHFHSAHVGLCLEVGEHIPIEYEQAFLDNVCKIPRERLIMSWSQISSKGICHFNPRPPEYISCEVTRRGWKIDREKTETSRGALARYRSAAFAPTFFVYVK